MIENKHFALKFIIACCQKDMNEIRSRTVVKYLTHNNFNSKEILKLAKKHAVIPLIYKTLQQQDEISKTLLLTLKKSYLYTVQKNMLLTAELIHILHILKSNHIDALTVKGPTLSKIAYGDISLRQYNDVDILIKKKDKTKMIATMLAQGYTSELDLKGNISDTYLNAVNVIGFYSPSSKRLIEIHWELLSKNYAIQWEETQIWKNTQNIRLNHSSLTILNFEQQLLYLCVHGSKHLFERLSWVCDIDRFIQNQKNIRWNFLLEEANRRGILRIFLLSLLLCNILFHLPLTHSILNKINTDSKIKELAKTIIKYQFSGSTQNLTGYNHFKLLYFMREKTSDKILFLWYATFATKFDDFKYIQLPSYLGFLYPLIRPLRLLRKHLK